ncbi:MAG: (2Fe-2S)-binding protein [Bryobacterales bacterium]|jgi:aerobic-type carbon monoxide dehydrogenase small subunit (CoxS/CutS family)|nr:(2Fe-2S)-binding protein [Bryobacterales bacterium]
MPSFQFTVNGKPCTVESHPERPLLDVLREDLRLTGTKFGCGEGQCRACTVLMDGKPTLSCLTPVRRAVGKSLTTIEGLAAHGTLHPVQQAFLDENAMQCGYCIPGMILQTVALLETNPAPTRQQTVAALDGNLCRCCGYERILSAVERAAALAKGQQPSSTARPVVVEAPHGNQ